MGVVYLVGLAWLRPDQVGIATDVYHHAARAMLAGNDFYAVRPPDHPAYGFLYPPVVVLAFVPHGLVGPTGAHLLQTGLSLLAAVGVGVLSLDVLESAGHSLDRIDRALVVGFSVLGTPMAANLLMGQVNPLLALGIAAGAILVERDRETAGGLAFGLVALVKLFPALVGAWLLRRRAWRAIAAATVAGSAALLAGVAVFGPEVTLRYVTEVVAGEAGSGASAGRYDPASERVTIRRQVAYLVPSLPPVWRFGVAVAVLAPVVLAAYRDVEDRVSRLVALAVTLLATLLVFPLEPFYLVLATFPVVPLCYLLEGWPRRLLLAGVVLVSATITLTTVRQGVALAGVPPGVADPLLGAARSLFAFVIPPTIGVWSMIAGCLLSGRSRESSASRPG
jgi:hypothetical protein